VLGRSLDELPPQTRRLVKLIDAYVRGECKRQAVKRADVRFSRRSLREAIAWGDTQLRVHLERLVELEYVTAHREGPGGKYVYELAYEVDADEARAQLAGLIDVDALKVLAAVAPCAATTPKSRGSDPQVAGRLRVDSGPVAGRSRAGEIAAEQAATRLPDESIEIDSKTHCSTPTPKRRSQSSYTQPAALASLAAGV